MNSKTNLCASKYQKNIPENYLKGSLTSQLQRKNTKIVKAFQKTQIQVKNQILDDLLQVYSWRSKTQLPIAKVMFYKVIDKNPNQINTTIEVSYQSLPLTLSDLNQISISNLLYLIKQAVIGFQKLFNVFGSFLISNKMIGINKNNKVKVWINQNFAINEPIDVQSFKNLNQKSFINQINDLFKKKAQKSNKTQILFNELGSCLKFQEYAQRIENFSKKNGIQMPPCYKVNDKEDRKNNVSKSPLRNPNQLTNNSAIFDKNKQAPKFLSKLQFNETNKSIMGTSTLNERLQKSRSITKSGIRNRTPLNHNRSQLNLHSPYKPATGQTPLKFQRKQREENSNKMDYSFQKKNKSSSPLQSKKSKPMAQSTNSLTNDDIKGFSEGRSFLNYQKLKQQENEVLKSDLNTTHTNSSVITTVSPRRLLVKKNSLFDVEQNMLESIVIGNEHDKPKTNLFSTSDLEYLGKLGKTVLQSCMPEDFEN